MSKKEYNLPDDAVDLHLTMPYIKANCDKHGELDINSLLLNNVEGEAVCLFCWWAWVKENCGSVETEVIGGDNETET